MAFKCSTWSTFTAVVKDNH